MNLKKIFGMGFLCLSLASLILLAGCANTEESSGEPQVQDTQQTQQQAPPGRQRNMPSEAMDSCAGKSEGDACKYLGDGETVTGTCRILMGGQMMCVSGNMEQMGNRTRMQVGGQSACEGKAKGDSCSLSMGGRSIEGSCINRDGEVICMPDGGGFQRLEG
ncbi:MAG: hypothetical protein JW724_00740 [Candidatus Altiarchaeota archaeon]|nr:hypothetical protein [Candidatus Altiarchaeota archaeon]